MYSEVEFALSNARDWTGRDFSELPLWFRGLSSNAAEPSYMVVANTTGGAGKMYFDDIRLYRPVEPAE